MCVIFNPAAGRRRAQRRLRAFLARWERHVDLRPTARPEHAGELAGAAVREGFDLIAAAGGDGTVHEVAGGLLRAAEDATDDAPVFAVVPIGSANDYAFSLRGQFGESDLDSPDAHPVDVGRLSWTDPAGDSTGEPGGERRRYFVCCCGAGLAGRVTQESRRIGWLQGVPLYGLAAVRALRAAGPPTDWLIARDDEPPVAAPTRSFHALLGRREGGFLLAPRAKLDDGAFETLRIGPAGRWELLRMLPGFARSGPPAGHPHVELGRGRSLALTAPDPLAVHADGELVLVPGDGVRAVRLDLLSGRLRAKACALG